MRGRLLTALMAAVVWMIAAPAVAAPPDGLAMLSSWAPDTVGGTIVGGDQTVTVVNHGAATTAPFILDLAPRPCACDRSEVIIDGGGVVGDQWLIPPLEPGESATVTIRYTAVSTSTIEPASHSAVRIAVAPTPIRRLGLRTIFAI